MSGAMEGCPEPLEKIFQKVEEESERRAQQEHLVSLKAAEATEKSLSAKRQKERRRGSISISRVGQLSEDDFVSTTQPPTPGSRSNVASNSPFYQSQIANASTNSVASGASAYSNEQAHTEDDNHVTQMQHIAAKPSISAKMIPRRLSRSHSASVIPNRAMGNAESNMIIGVSVQEATTVKTVREEGDDDDVAAVSTTVQASSKLRSQPSRTSLSVTTKTAPSGWFSIAKGFTQKFKRKNKTPVTSVSFAPS
ncbi:unnamed protein product [Cyclocybe aegerita]|uniref:Uncharacterized protein n=1 Tax=Cyclocybe aegerita TaxID=1973307 RepID=A0A8S0X6B5_CYCAE|nr:unnamed protein product [Cyclocybe aegerita]